MQSLPDSIVTMRSRKSPWVHRTDFCEPVFSTVLRLGVSCCCGLLILHPQFELRNQSVRYLQSRCKFSQISFFPRIIGIYCKARGKPELAGLFKPIGKSGNSSSVVGLAYRVKQKSLVTCVQIEFGNVIENPALFIRTNMPISIGCRDHRAHQRQLEGLSIGCKWANIEWSGQTRRWRFGLQILYRLPVFVVSWFRVLTLPALPGTKGNSAQRSGTAIGCHFTSHLPRFLATQQQAHQAASCQPAQRTSYQTSWNTPPSLLPGFGCC